MQDLRGRKPYSVNEIGGGGFVTTYWCASSTADSPAQPQYAAIRNEEKLLQNFRRIVADWLSQPEQQPTDTGAEAQPGSWN